MSQPKFTRIVQALPEFVPFVGPEATERARGQTFKVRLGANESVFGPSPKAIAAMEAAACDTWMYSDPENHDLRQAIAAHHNVEMANVVVGEGIDGLLGLTVRMFAEPGEAVVTSDGAYPTFNFHVAGQGAQLFKIPFVGDREDFDGLAVAAYKTGARIVYVSNPNNPMGTWWPADEIERLRRKLPDEALLVLDEAYADTAPRASIPPVNTNLCNVIRYRTFSKAYGLAGARIGYALGPASTVQAFEKVRNHYGINRVGQIGALAALKDQTYLAEVVKRIGAAREKLYAIAEKHKLRAIPSAANFVAIDCGGGPEKAEHVLHHLLAAGVFVRRPSVAPLNRCIRVSCAPDEDLEVFSDALGAALASDGES